jgi:hypothetical protein
MLLSIKYCANRFQTGSNRFKQVQTGSNRITWDPDDEVLPVRFHESSGFFEKLNKIEIITA